jgi:hypothetical protein
MGTQQHKSRGAWEDRFRVPKPEELLDGLPVRARANFKSLRDELAAGTGAREYIQWLGPWGWAFVYRTPDCNGVAKAYLVPDPHRPRVCVPADERAIAGADDKSISKAAREVLAAAPQVDGVRWATWEVESRDAAKDAMKFAMACCAK